MAISWSELPRGARDFITGSRRKKQPSVEVQAGVAAAEHRVPLNLKDFVHNQREYYLDRPTMKYSNQNVLRILDLLGEEINECAVSPKKGKIDGFEIADYRQQEASDVFIFALCVLEQLGAHYTDHLATKESSFQQFSQQRLAGVQSKPGTVWRQQHEEVFQANLHDLQQAKTHTNVLMERLKKQRGETYLSVNELDTTTRQELTILMIQLMGIAWTILELCSQSPIQSLFEKSARNMAKYPMAIKVLQEDGTYLRQASEPQPGEEPEEVYKRFRSRSKEQWKQIRGNQQFYNNEGVSSRWRRYTKSLVRIDNHPYFTAPSPELKAAYQADLLKGVLR